MEKILDIIDSIAYEKGLKPEDVQQSLKDAVIKVAKEMINSNLNYDVEIDEKSKSLKLFQRIIVCEDTDERVIRDSENYIRISEAKDVDEDLELGDELRCNVSFDKMNRTIANMLNIELEKHIQKLLSDQIFLKYKSKLGKIVHSSVVKTEDGDTFLELEEVRAILPQKNRIKGESFKTGQTIKAILKHIELDKKRRLIIELSRTTPKFLEELLSLEVPEIKEKEVIVHKVARIPGVRAKVALSSSNPKIDPIGAAVGVKGSRINAIGKELSHESIDCIEYSPLPEIFVARALSPAIIIGVKIMDTNKAQVTVAKDQKSKAIGKEGINIRLATMLTGYEIELLESEIRMTKEDMQGKDFSKQEKKDISSLASLFKD